MSFEGSNLQSRSDAVFVAAGIGIGVAGMGVVTALLVSAFRNGSRSEPYSIAGPASFAGRDCDFYGHTIEHTPPRDGSSSAASHPPIALSIAAFAQPKAHSCPIAGDFKAIDDCVDCRRAVPGYEALASKRRQDPTIPAVVVVEVPAFAPAEQRIKNYGSGAIAGRLSDDRD